MNINILYAILSVVVVSLLSFVGIAFLSFKTSQLNKWVHWFVSFAVGAILGNAFLHLIPEAFSHSENTMLISFLIFGGILTMFLLEKVFHWNHDHNLDAHEHKPTNVKAYGYISLIADGVHNLADGMLIGAAWLVSPEVGLAVTLAIVIHEIPQEISDFSILIHSGFTRKKALLVNFLSACSAIIGTIIALFLGSKSEMATQIILPLAAGGFIYLAGSDLIPELHKSNTSKNALQQVVLIIAGFLLIFFTTTDHAHITKQEEHHPSTREEINELIHGGGDHDHSDHEGHQH